VGATDKKTKRRRWGKSGRKTRGKRVLSPSSEVVDGGFTNRKGADGTKGMNGRGEGKGILRGKGNPDKRKEVENR